MGTRHLSHVVVWSSALALSLPMASVAESELPEFGALDDEAVLFEDVPSVFGASKYEQQVTEAPSSISIVTADEIRKYGYRSFTDVLDSLRGFYTTNDLNYNLPGVRGFSPPGDYGNRILLLLDGKRVNDAMYDSVSIGQDFIVDIDLIDRVEVIRGPSSSLYGSSAFFAVVNVITKRGRDFKGGETAASRASFDTTQGRASFGDKYANGVELLVSHTRFDSDGDQRIYFPEFDDPATNNGVAEDVDDERAKSYFAKLSFSDFSFEAAYNDRDKNIPTGSYGTFFNDPRTKTTDKQLLLFLNYQHTFANQIELNADIDYGKYDYKGNWVYDYSDTATPDLAVWEEESEAQWWRSEVQAGIYSLDRHKLVVGAEYRDNTQLDQFVEDPFDVYLDDQRDSNVWGVYAQDEFEIRDDLILNAGVRYDNYSTVGGTTNPRMALIYSPLEKTTLKFLYGSAFRAPNAYELYYNDGGDTQKPPKDDLDSEIIKTTEFVLEQGIGEHLRAVADIFYYKTEDLIALVNDPADDLLYFDNLAEVETYGVELELEGKLPGGWKGRASYSYQDAEDQSTGDSLANSPHNMFKVNLIAPVIRNRLFAGLEYQYLGERQTVFGDDLDGFSLVNLTMNVPGLWRGLEVSTSVYNLLDADYGDVGSSEHLQASIPQDGRTYRMKAYYHF